MQLLDFGSHLHPQLGIEVRQRLVEQKYLRVAHDRASHGDALALAARELPWIAIEQYRQTEDIRRLGNMRFDFTFALLREHERKRHVVANGHVRIERVVLEHHRDVALLRRHAVDHLTADADFAVGDLLEPGNHPQQGRLAASRRADQNAKFSVSNIDVDAAYHLRRAEILAHRPDAYRCHSPPS